MSVETYSSAKQKIEKEILRLQKQMKSLRVKQRRPVIASIVKSMQDNEITIEEVAEALENSARRGAGAGSNGPKNQPASKNTATPAPRTPGRAVAAHHAGLSMLKPMVAAVKSSLSNKFWEPNKRKGPLEKAVPFLLI